VFAQPGCAFRDQATEHWFCFGCRRRFSGAEFGTFDQPLDLASLARAGNDDTAPHFLGVLEVVEHVERLASAILSRELARDLPQKAFDSLLGCGISIRNLVGDEHWLAVLERLLFLGSADAPTLTASALDEEEALIEDWLSRQDLRAENYSLLTGAAPPLYRAEGDERHFARELLRRLRSRAPPSETDTVELHEAD
jgi:hypothetical protein